MKKITFEFEISDDNDIAFVSSSHNSASPAQIYACALIASRDAGKTLSRSMFAKGKSEKDIDLIFDKARDFARDDVSA